MIIIQKISRLDHPGVLRDALARLNKDLPAEALEDAFRKLNRSEGTSMN